MTTRIRAKYICVKGDDIRMRKNVVSLPVNTNKYDTIHAEVVKASSWDGDITVYDFDLIEHTDEVCCSNCKHSRHNNETLAWCEQHCINRESFERVD